MKPVFKNLLIFSLLVPITWFISHVYVYRHQTIDFSNRLPEELNICGTKYHAGDVQYDFVMRWLHNSVDGWYQSVEKTDTWAHIKGNGFDMSLYQGVVRIDYLTEGVIKSYSINTNTEELVKLCRKS